MVSKKKKKKIFFFYFSKLLKNRYGIWKKKMAIFDWECGRNLVPREGQKTPVGGILFSCLSVLLSVCL